MDSKPNPMQPEFQLPASAQVTTGAVAPQPQPMAPGQSQPTLLDYSVGAQQVSRDLGRQTDAYAHFKAIVELIDELAADPTQKVSGLPFVIVRFPTQNEHPDEMRIDLNMKSSETLVSFRPLFESMMTEAGEQLLTAWESFIQIGTATSPIVAASRQAMSG